jgi:hypothetical protein
VAGIPLWLAAQAAKQGLSANKAYEALHAAGESMARGTFLKLYAQVRADLAQQVDEITRPLGAKPRAAEIRPYVTQGATGFMQYVDVYVRDRTTGEVFAVPFGVRTDELLIRADVIETALALYGVHAEEYDQQVLGSTYTSTYLYGPAA